MTDEDLDELVEDVAIGHEIEFDYEGVPYHVEWLGKGPKSDKASLVMWKRTGEYAACMMMKKEIADGPTLLPEVRKFLETKIFGEKSLIDVLDSVEHTIL